MWFVPCGCGARRGNLPSAGLFSALRKERDEKKVIWTSPKLAFGFLARSTSNVPRAYFTFLGYVSSRLPAKRSVFLSRTFPHTLHLPPPPNNMSAFLAGSPLVAKVTAKQVARRNVTVRAAAPNECVRSQHILFFFIYFGRRR